MLALRRCCSVFLLLIGVCASWMHAEQSAPLTADAIMARVGANQDRTEAARQHYVYVQHIRIASRKPGGHLMCEEVTDSRVSPQEAESHQELLSLAGRYWQKSEYITYTQLPAQDTDQGMDRDLVENLRKNLADDKSKDGLGKGLFPLTTEQQSHYQFVLLGRQTMNGHDVFHLSFRPRDKNDFDWKGQAFIDAREFQPVVVYTQLSRKIPLGVRVLLGTNLPGLGFSVTYERQADGVWFPVSFGTEFRMRVLFFISRDISMSLANLHFEKTHTDARILDGVKLATEASPAETPSAVH